MINNAETSYPGALTRSGAHTCAERPRARRRAPSRRQRLVATAGETRTAEVDGSGSSSSLFLTRRHCSRPMPS
ncbi:unnamed protein product [Lampetra fluviatilis]